MQAKHRLSDEAAGTSEYLPATQLLQNVDMAADAYFPVGQSMQIEAVS